MPLTNAADAGDPRRRGAALALVDVGAEVGGVRQPGVAEMREPERCSRRCRASCNGCRRVLVTVPGAMHGDSRTAPVRPPPGPVPPGSGAAGPGISPQHELESPPAASSKMTISSRPPLNAWDAVILGTQVFRKASAAGEPAGLAVGAVGVMPVVAQVGRDEGVVACARDARRGPRAASSRLTTWLSHDAGVVDDRVEIDERVVAGRVHVGRRRRLGVVGPADHRMTAGGRLAGRISAHVLVVVAPGQAVRASSWAGERRAHRRGTRSRCPAAGRTSPAAPRRRSWRTRRSRPASTGWAPGR